MEHMNQGYHNQQSIETLEKFILGGSGFGIAVYPSYNSEDAVDLDYTNELTVTQNTDDSCEIAFNKRVINVDDFTRFYSSEEGSKISRIAFEVDNGLFYELTNVDLMPE